MIGGRRAAEAPNGRGYAPPIRRTLTRVVRRGTRLTRRGSDARAQGWLDLPENPDLWGWAKPESLVRAYEELLAPLRHERFALLEMGVAEGDSLAMWREGFPHATIVGVDVEVPELDLGPRVHVVRGDQGDRELLEGLAESYAPDGFKLIIDDAAHVGAASARSLQALFADHLSPGGLYVIEDWETGYYPAGSWPDAAECERALDASELDEVVAGQADAGSGRMPSHDYGMVGLVKRLVDHVARATIADRGPDKVANPLPIESITVRNGMAVLRRAA